MNVELRMQNYECRIENAPIKRHHYSSFFILHSALAIFFILHSAFFIPTPALADTPPAQESATATAGSCDNPTSFQQKVICQSNNFFGRAGYSTDAIEGADANPIALRVGVIIRTALSLVGIVFLLITVYSGIQWMMAGGNEETVKKARTRLTRATIGIFIVVGAWIITSFVLGSALQGPRQPDTRTFRPFVR